MKKVMLAFVCFLFLFSCSKESNDDSATSLSPYRPPAWIQGTWGDKAIPASGQSEQPLFRFTSDNICQISYAQTLCWKESIQQSPQALQGSDSSTSDTYTATFGTGNGANTITVKFKKISSTKMLYYFGTLSTEIEKLN